MDKEDVKRLLADPKYIPGIYNYCDGWCERCPMTARCQSFALNEEQPPEGESRDLKNAAFWEQLQETFAVAEELLEEAIEEPGVNVAGLVATEELLKQEREHAEESPLARAAEEYGRRARAWCVGAEVMLALADARPDKEARAVTEALEIIQWYQGQIYTKLIRALGSDLHDSSEDASGLPRDADGSAKVALIGIDRSIMAWCVLRAHFLEKETEMLPILVHLTRLCRGVEAAFPRARSFVRPGLDAMPTE